MPLANVSAARGCFHLIRDHVAFDQVGEGGLVVGAVVERVDLDIGDPIVTAIADLKDLDVVLGVRCSHPVLEEVISLVELEVVLEHRR